MDLTNVPTSELLEELRRRIENPMVIDQADAVRDAGGVVLHVDD